MRRRVVIGGLAATAGAGAWPMSAGAQEPKLVGLLNNGSAEAYDRHMLAFKAGLSETGYVEGRNLAIEYRWAEGRDDRLPSLAADLVSRGVAAIAATGGTNAALAVKSATATVPIVFAIGADPVKFGLVASLNQPGGNVTGASFFANALLPKQLELIHETTRRSSAVGFLVNPRNANAEQDTRDLANAAARTGVELIVLEAQAQDEIAGAFARFHEKGVSALLIFPDALFTSVLDQIVAAALRYSLPSISHAREFALAGGLIAYGSDQAETYRQAGQYVGRVLKGEKPTELPITFPTKFELLINLKTAKALGLTIPPTLLARADEVIE